MEVLVIHDFRRPDKELWECQDGLIQQRVKYNVFPCITGRSTTVESINASHKQCVKIARYMEWPEVCIMESDVVFPASDGWEYFLKNKPEEYEIYTAGTYDMLSILRGLWNNTLLEGGTETHNLPITHIAGFHCYCIHESYYDIFLSLPVDEHIDVAQTGHCLPTVCYPFAAIQRPGWSAINKANDVNYNRILTLNDVYGPKETLLDLGVAAT